MQRLLNQPASSYTDVETRQTIVTVYLSKKPNGLTLRRALHTGLKQINDCGLRTGRSRISLQKVRREDWAESWKRHFRPIEIGSALLIKPGWVKRRPRKNQAVVVLDPGLSFGTGQHPTTEFCLSQLAARRDRNHRQSVLDIGTGSGILAIAAAKLGYAPVFAFDFDIAAARIARANARRNRVSEKIRIRRADITRLPKQSAARYDIICANLTSNLLIAEVKRIRGRLKPRGALVLAGILKTEFGIVQNAYRDAGLVMVSSRIGNEWQSAVFQFMDSAKKFH